MTIRSRSSIRIVLGLFFCGFPAHPIYLFRKNSSDGWTAYSYCTDAKSECGCWPTGWCKNTDQYRRYERGTRYNEAQKLTTIEARLHPLDLLFFKTLPVRNLCFCPIEEALCRTWY